MVLRRRCDSEEARPVGLCQRLKLQAESASDPRGNGKHASGCCGAGEAVAHEGNGQPGRVQGYRKRKCVLFG